MFESHAEIMDRLKKEIEERAKKQDPNAKINIQNGDFVQGGNDGKIVEGEVADSERFDNSKPIVENKAAPPPEQKPQMANLGLVKN